MLSAIVIAAALIAVLAPWVGKRRGRNAGWILGPALFATGVALWLSAGDEPLTQSVSWLPRLGVEFSLRLDGLSLVFALLVLLVGGVVLTYSARYMPPGNQSGYYGLMSLFAAAMLVLVLADDVVVMFVAWEITTLCSFFLIARSGVAARPPALRTLLVTVMGGLALLAAVATMVVHTGTTQLSEILVSPAWQDSTLTAVVATLVAVAAFTKSAQFPFHAWLPDAMAAATPVSAYLHAAAMVKAGIYLLMRMSPAFADVMLWNMLLMGAGLITAVLGAAAAMRSHDLKQLLAFSTISQLGFLVAVIGIGTPTALTAATVHVIAHALFKSALFMLVGVINMQTGSRDVRLLSVARAHMPVTATLVTLAAMSMAGVPPLLGFISKETIFSAALEAPGPGWWGALAAGTLVASAIMTFAYAGRIVLGASGGLTLANAPREAKPAILVPLALPVLAGALAGIVPWAMDPLVSSASSAAIGADMAIHLQLFHGINAALVMSAVVIVVGSVMVWQRGRIEKFLLNADNPLNALAVVDGVRRALMRLGTWTGNLTRSDSPTRHLALPVALVTLVAVGAIVAKVSVPDVVGEPTRPLDWLLVGLVALGVVGAISATGRISAVAIIGVVGFGVTLWFLTLGAPDVALTQLLVEVLTVVVMVLLLRRLPPRFHPTTRRRAVGAGAVALVAAVISGLGVWTMTGRRELSRAGEYYLSSVKDDTGGTNVVNTILVDYRALDTLGELSVLGITAVALLVLVRSRGLLPARTLRFAVPDRSPLASATENTVFGRTAARLIGPVLIVMSIWFLFRGHYEPGGGFIAALIAGAAITQAYLVAPSDRQARPRWPYLTLIGSGIVVATVSGLLGMLDGAFLKPLRMYLGTYNLTTSFLFDLGVYLAVVGVICAALTLLGGGREVQEADVTVPVQSRRGREVKV